MFTSIFIAGSLKYSALRSLTKDNFSASSIISYIVKSLNNFVVCILVLCNVILQNRFIRRTACDRNNVSLLFRLSNNISYSFSNKAISFLILSSVDDSNDNILFLRLSGIGVILDFIALLIAISILAPGILLLPLLVEIIGEGGEGVGAALNWGNSSLLLLPKDVTDFAADAAPDTAADAIFARFNPPS